MDAAKVIGMPTISVEERLRSVEDRLEILNLIASHPPAADTGSARHAAAIFSEDGRFDRGVGLSSAIGAQELGAMVGCEAHQQAISLGLAHISGLPHIVLQGDTAVATSYLQILTPDGEGSLKDLPNHGASRGYRIHRVAANRWLLERTERGWRVRERILRPIDGSPAARELLTQACPSVFETDSDSR